MFWCQIKFMGVPLLVLYLAPGSANLTQEGSVISGNGIHLEAEGVGNSGVIAARQGMTVIAGDKGVVNNQGTMQSGGLMLVDSQGDIKNQSASIQGRDVALQSQGSIINEIDAEYIEETRDGDDYWRTEYGDASQIEGVGDVTLNAGEHIVVTGSRIAGENVGMQAAGNIQIESLAVREGFDGQHAGGDYQYSQVRQLASSIEATMNVMATAGNSIGITASNITAGNNIKLSALEGDILIRAAANEDHENYHYEDSEEEKQITNHTVRQQQSALSAGGDLQLDAGGDLIAIAAKLQSGGDMSLSAGGDIALLAAQNSDYHLYESDKDGDYGAKSHKKDEIQSVTNVTTSLESGGDLSINSEGDQHYQAARLESGGDISIVSGGHITFESVKDLYRETHERSQGDLAWNKMSGEGQVDETLLQTAIVAQGNLAIDAAEGMTIDIKDMDQQSVSQLIDGMVANNPDLAWLKEADANGDVDWQRVQEMHDSWDYSSQSMGAASALVVAIVVTVLTAGAGAAVVNGVAGAGFTAAGGVAASGLGAAAAGATGAVITGAATTTTSALINNQGDMGATLDSLDHSETYQGLAVSGVTAGLMSGVDYVFGGTTDSVNNITKGFDLGDPKGIAGFTLHNAAQAGVSAGVNSSIYGTSFTDALNSNLESQGNNVLSAVVFNKVGDLADGWMKTDAHSGNVSGVNFWKEGGLGRTSLHALAGGAVTQITDGDFSAGAIAAGANQFAAGFLTETVGNAYDPVKEKTQYEAWRTAASQLTGLAAAVAADKDVNQGAWIAKQADTYNRQLHPDEIAFAMDDDRVAKFADQFGLTEDQARQELMRSGAAAMDEGWAQALAGDDTNTVRAREFLGTELQEAGRTDLFQVTADDFANHRINLKETFGNENAYGLVLDHLALPNDVTREQMWAASGQGSGDGLLGMFKPTLDQAYMGLDLIANNGQYTFGQVWDGLVDISYMGAETKLQIIQGDLLGAEYGFGAASTAMGVGLSLGATGTSGRFGLFDTDLGTMPSGSVVSNSVDATAMRRAYLNNKYGRTGDLNLDINVRGNRETAVNFYRQSGYSDLDMASHLNGIDFTQPVEVLKFGKGQAFYQWDAPTTYRGGQYFAVLENSTPSQLGINPSKVGFGTDTVFSRIQTPLVTNRPVYGLKSTAAPINDTWSMKHQPFMAEGGAPQIFTTDLDAFSLNSWVYYGR